MLFSKFDGAGNDFILIDMRNSQTILDKRTVAHLCHRRFGIGADGLMTLSNASGDFDFEMQYYNSDGQLASMCGNGGRCITVFAHLLGLGTVNDNNHKTFRFLGPDGEHQSEIITWNSQANMGIVRLSMRTVATNSIRRIKDQYSATGWELDGWFLDTGSPHFVQRVENLKHIDIVREGRAIRLREDIFPSGTNVDFIEDDEDGTLCVRTYERGVEDETMACGTGVTAVAIISGNKRVRASGGDFRVDFTPTSSAYENIMLTGPVAYNFKGDVNI